MVIKDAFRRRRNQRKIIRRLKSQLGSNYDDNQSESLSAFDQVPQNMQSEPINPEEGIQKYEKLEDVQREIKRLTKLEKDMKQNMPD